MERLQQLAISAEGFIFDPITGNSFTTNKTGLFIIEALNMGKQEQEIISMLMEKYELDKENATRDFMDFMEQMRSYKLI